MANKMLLSEVYIPSELLGVLCMQYKNIKILVIILISCIGLSCLSYAQIDITGSNELPYTPNKIIENVLLGPGVSVENIQFDGTEDAVGVFKNGNAFIGLDYGIVLSTGTVKTIEEPNDENTNAKGETSDDAFSDNEDELQQIAGANSTLLDIARYEITFIPESDTIRFRYVFASEEYPEFVCSNFNDVFGFFISGPDPNGGNYNALNIARVPNPADPTGTSFLNNNVAINSVNNGTLGFLGSIDPDNCMGDNGSLEFSQYYNEVLPGQYPVFDAYLDVFIAQAAVVPCQEYTIKLAIADVNDRDFDSAVFLEAGSFYSSALSINLNTASNDGSIAEGCAAAEIEIELPFPKSTDTNIQIAPIPNGTFADQAQSGVDFLPLPNPINIPAGASSASIVLEAIEDNIEEGDEYIYLDVERSTCKRDTIKIKIRDNILTQVMLPGDSSLCANTLMRLAPEYDPPLVEFEGKVFRNSNNVILEESGLAYSSTLEVQGVEINQLEGGVLSRICIDELVSRDLTDIEVYVLSPQGQILELSTNNGLRNKPASCQNNPNDSDCIDSYVNTCFNVTANDNVNNGNPLQGSVFVGNENYTGTYLPEGEWESLYNGEALVNGTWELIVKSDSVSIADISNGNSYLSGWSLHFESSYEVDHVWSPNYEIFCTECDTTFVSPDDDVTYKLNVTDTYGCTSFDDIRIEVLPVSEIPQIIDCVALSPSSIQITWEDVGADVEYYNVNQNFIPPFFETDQTTFVFEGLEADVEHTFYVAAFNGFCTTNLDSIKCITPPCMDGPEIDNVQAIAPSCTGRNDGRIVASATADDGGELTYYINGQVNQTGEFSFLLAGDYLLRIVDSDGCSTVQTVTVPPAENIPFSLTLKPISCVGFSDATAEIDILESDNGPYTILWQNSSDQFLQEDLGMGTYYFTLTDGGGCSNENNIVISDPEPLAFDIIDAQLPPCYGDQGSIDITMSGGEPNYIFEWADTNENTANVNFFPGSYSVTVTDANNCTISTEIEIEERFEINLLPDTIQAACIGELSQEIELDIVGGAAPFDVEWNTNISGTDVIDVPVGFYELTITDNNNCLRIDSVEIINYPDLDITFDFREPDCYNISNGIISLDSTTYTDGVLLQERDIIWEDGSTDEAIGNLFGDSTYQYVITDSFGCKHEGSFYLPAPPEIVMQVDTLNLLDCFGDVDGSFGVSATGGIGDLTICWPTNITNLQNDTASDLEAGIYIVIVKDEDGCSEDISFAMTQPEELNFNADIRDVKCFGESTGQILGEIIGGVEPYEIEWSNGSMVDSLVNISSGVYDVFIEDANGCTFEESYEVEQPEEALVVAFQANKTECFETSTGSIEIFAEGGSMPYNFLLDSINYFDNTLITGLAAGSYDLLVIDGNGCELNFNDIIIMETNEVFVSLPSDTTVEYGSSLELEFMSNISNLEAADFLWESSSPEVTLTCYDCPNPIVESVTADFFVTLTIRDENGCKYTTNNYYIWEEDNSFIDVPTAFSPNQDNRNDFLLIFGRGELKVMNFEIFDRWGELILREEDIIMPMNREYRVWDGTFNGVEMDSGVYVWKIRYEKRNGEIDFLEGNVTLLR